MRYLSDATTAVKALVLATVSLGLLLSSNVSAQQTGTDVNVRICPQVSNSRLSITQPQGDSKVDSPHVVIEGGVDYISQIDFFINDVYDHTIALGYATTAFRSAVTLPEGTHTIRLEAVDSCFPDPIVETLVVTYQPKTTPSNGSNIITDVPSLGGGILPNGLFSRPLIRFPGSGNSNSVTDGEPTDGKGTPSTNTGQVTEKQPPKNSSRSILDIGTVLNNQRLDLLLRAILIIIGVILLLAPWLILAITDYIRQALVDHLDRQATPHASHPHMHVAGRFVGAGLILIAFLI